VAEHGGVTLRLELPAIPGSTADLLVGSEAPIAGWLSRRFDKRVPIPTLRWRATLPGSCALKTRIALSGL
jgi:hypothetical protein